MSKDHQRVIFIRRYDMASFLVVETKIVSLFRATIYKPILCFICAICLLCCSIKICVTYYSEPTGAKVYDDGRLLASTPLTLYYEPSPDFINGDCMFLKPLLARWLSGAENSPTSIKACASEGKQLVFTFFRPQNIPGSDVDAQYASQYEYQREIRRIRTEENNMRLIQNLNSISNAYPGSSKSKNADGGYMTKDANGVLVNSNDCYQTKDALGAIVNSAGCYK